MEQQRQDEIIHRLELVVMEKDQKLNQMLLDSQTSADNVNKGLVKMYEEQLEQAKKELSTYKLQLTTKDKEIKKQQDLNAQQASQLQQLKSHAKVSSELTSSQFQNQQLLQSRFEDQSQKIIELENSLKLVQMNVEGKNSELDKAKQQISELQMASGIKQPEQSTLQVPAQSPSKISVKSVYEPKIKLLQSNIEEMQAMLKEKEVYLQELDKMLQLKNSEIYQLLSEIENIKEGEAVRIENIKKSMSSSIHNLQQSVSSQNLELQEKQELIQQQQQQIANLTTQLQQLMQQLDNTAQECEQWKTLCQAKTQPDKMSPEQYKEQELEIMNQSIENTKKLLNEQSRQMEQVNCMNLDLEKDLAKLKSELESQQLENQVLAQKLAAAPTQKEVAELQSQLQAKSKTLQEKEAKLFETLVEQ